MRRCGAQLLEGLFSEYDEHDLALLLPATPSQPHPADQPCVALPAVRALGRIALVVTEPSFRL